MKSLQIALLTIVAAVFFSGCAELGGYGGRAFILDPINPPREGYVPQVDWTRAPLSVAEREAFLDKRLERLRNRETAGENAGLYEARADAEQDFEDGLLRGTRAPSFFYPVEREAYFRRFDELTQNYRAKKERIAQRLGEAREIEDYRSRHPR